MKFDTALPPEAFFHLPGRDPGLSYVEAPDWIMRRVPGARIRQIAASDIPAVQQRIERRLEPRWSGQESNVTFEFNTVPVVLQQAGHRGSLASAYGKWIMNGAAGDRLIEKYFYDNPKIPERRVYRFFAEARAAEPDPLPVWDRGIGDLDVVIECRNQRNFYHFLTEALCHLSHFAAMRHMPRITFQCRQSQVRDYLMNFVEALYPELAGRVGFVKSQITSEQVLAPYNHRHYLYQIADPRTDAEIASAAQQDEWWGRIGAHRLRRRFVFRNSYDTSLRKLRERALFLINPAATAALPRRIIVLRDPEQGARDREFEGGEAMVAALKPLGFTEVYFERMAPLQQVATMQAADIVVAPHGASLAHMMFARADAHVIEIGSAQTLSFRWGDFLGNAHTSGCAYTTIFADVSGDTPDVITKMRRGGPWGVRVGRRALDALVELVERAG